MDQTNLPAVCHHTLAAAVLRVPAWVFNGHVLTAVTNTQHVQVAGRLQDQTKKRYTTVFSMARRLQDHTKKHYTTVFSMARRLQDHTKETLYNCVFNGQETARSYKETLYNCVFNGQETARSYKRSVIQLCFQWPGDCKIIQRNIIQLCFQWPGDCKIIQKKHYTTVFSMARRLQDETKKTLYNCVFNGQETARSYTSPHLTYPIVYLTVGAPRMIGQPLFSILLCFRPFEGLHPTLILSTLLCCLPISFSVCLSFSLLVQCPEGSSLKVLLILLCAHTISVFVSSQW